MTRLIRKPEMAKLLGISRATLDRYRMAGKVSWVKLGGAILFDPEVVRKDVGRWTVQCVQ
jgi:predicted DNA-binding transcriptional regulator AlpA